MNTNCVAEIDALFASKGWRYDAGNEELRRPDGTTVEWLDALSDFPELTADHLEEYVLLKASNT